MPGLPFIQQLAANPAAASQLMQGLASMLGSAQAAPAAAAPAATPPAASASVTLPQPPAALPGAAPAPINTPAAAAAPATAPQNLVPTGQMNVPSVPFLPVPLPQQVSFPGDLASLMPAGTPLANLAPAPATAPAAPAPAAPAAPAPAAPAAPAPAVAAPAATPNAGLAPVLIPLSALP